ncbi:uncharacterized protein BDCG_03851 [Blastomyces dermatitidis ER-3]|uniref:Uncharacterized protein n=1 Tax=Ajellomyces dermatitidis (strain ER-3 / ATCC MYA-2586) TaxID=559297 RepID=A0ABP2EXX0_AJEDR|nr:uncharacterized protein BDCG_03851 [Blastomyces dermatitidis ER-3]EEQ88731.2 hypothetical protein BDCG_03851 [Blastomyces dermatitidis ER-3]
MELKLQRLRSEEFEPDSTSISATDNFFQLWGDTLSAMRCAELTAWQTACAIVIYTSHLDPTETSISISYNRGMQNVPQARYVGLPFMDIVDEGNHDKLSPIGVTGELDSSNDTATEAKNTPPFPPSSSDARYRDAFIQDAMCPQAGTIEQLNRQCPTSLPNFKPYTLKEHDVWGPPALGRPWAKLIVIKGSKGSQQTRITLRISHAQYGLTLTRPLAYVPSWLNNDEHRPEIGCCGKPPSFGRNVVLINPPDSNTQQYNSTAVVLGFCRYGFILPTYSQ